MDNQTWLSVKHHQIQLYRKRTLYHKKKRSTLTAIYTFGGICAAIMPWIMIANSYFLIGLSLFILIPVSILVWKLSTYENRSVQLLMQLADVLEKELKRGRSVINKSRSEIKNDRSLVLLKKNITTIETRFLSNDDELFVRKAVWKHFMDRSRQKRIDEARYEKASVEYYSRLNRNMGFTLSPKPGKRYFSVCEITLGPVWNTDIPYKQGYKDSNSIGDEWAIIKALRQLIWTHNIVEHDILEATTAIAQKNPVVYERYLRKNKVIKKMKEFKWRSGVHYLSPAAKMRLVTFVEEVLALEPMELNEATVTLLHEKNEQIKKYTDEFWSVHKRSLKFYWFEALWLLLLIPFIAGAGNLINAGAIIEAVLLFTTGAALVAFGEMALVVKQKIKLNGKKLIPPLIGSLIGLRHAMCADTESEIGIDNYRRSFKNLEKHFIMTTPEIDSVMYVKNNLRDEDRTSELHAADDICQDAQRRLDRYYTMFHLYRRKCLQYGCLELFLAIMLVPVWGIGLFGLAYFGFVGMGWLISLTFTLSILVFEIIAIRRHIRVWRFKEMYLKIYQGLSVLIVDGDLRLNPDKLNDMFIDIEQSALEALCTDPEMELMAATISRVSGLEIPKDVKPHELDRRIQEIKQTRVAEIQRNKDLFNRYKQE